MQHDRTSLEPRAPDCGCGPAWRKPKPNGTCATCGGWLPGERPPSLVAMWSAPTDNEEQ